MFQLKASQQELLNDIDSFFILFCEKVYQIFLKVSSVFESCTSLTCVLKTLRTTTLKCAVCVSFNFKSFLISRSSFSLQILHLSYIQFHSTLCHFLCFFLFIGFNHLCSLWSPLQAACALVRELITSPRSYLQSFSVPTVSGKINNSQNKSDLVKAPLCFSQDIVPGICAS